MARLNLLAISVVVSVASSSARADDPSDSRLRFLASRLDVPLELEKGDSQLPLLLESIAAMASPAQSDKNPKMQVQILVAEDQFARMNGGFDPEKTTIKLRNNVDHFPLRTVLDTICCDLDAGYLVRRDFIEIVPIETLRKELNYPDGPNSDLRNLVVRFYDDVPLQAAFNDLAKKYNQNIALSPLVQKELEQKINARLLNVPFDVAVATLADMAELKLVRKANVTLVTTKEQAANLNAEYAKKHKFEREIPVAPKFMGL
jgi:hypothetical protein